MFLIAGKYKMTNLNWVSNIKESDVLKKVIRSHSKSASLGNERMGIDEKNDKREQGGAAKKKCL